jgi:hypothetical protein
MQPPLQRGKRPDREADFFPTDAEGPHKRWRCGAWEWGSFALSLSSHADVIQEFCL